jgi:hypothetical protein
MTNPMCFQLDGTVLPLPTAPPTSHTFSAPAVDYKSGLRQGFLNAFLLESVVAFRAIPNLLALSFDFPVIWPNRHIVTLSPRRTAATYQSTLSI